MKEVRNSNNKLVCCIDDENNIIEIVQKGCKTRIQILGNGNYIITNE